MHFITFSNSGNSRTAACSRKSGSGLDYVTVTLETDTNRPSRNYYRRFSALDVNCWSGIFDLDVSINCLDM